MATAEKPGAPPPEAAAPTIIKKRIFVEDAHGGGHGSSGWKIALADMMTALMAFFLLMWLLGATNEDKRKSIADYFRPASHSQIVFGELAGSTGLFGGKSIIDTDGFPYTAKQSALLERLTPRAQGGPAPGFGASQEEQNREGSSEDSSLLSGLQHGKREQNQETYEKVEKELRKRITENKKFEAIRDQVVVVRDKEGLRIDLIDKADFSMFGLGTAEMNERGAALIREVANTISALPNRVAIRGHTDSLGFAPDSLRTNWSLSAERAEATRQLMHATGLSETRFSRIEGVADTNPSIPGNPADPRNRRVSITVLNL